MEVLLDKKPLLAVSAYWAGSCGSLGVKRDILRIAIIFLDECKLHKKETSTNWTYI